MPQPIRQLLPGVLHWMVPHPNHGQEVSSYALTETGVLIDPLTPPEGVEWFAEQGAEPREILLSCRHHLRDSVELASRYGCNIHAPSPGMDAFKPSDGVVPYEHGDRLAGNVLADVIDTLSPDETALYLPDHLALVVADGVINAGGRLSFVPDFLIGDDPEPVKAGLTVQFQRLLDTYDFDHVLCTHGEPILGTGRKALGDFVAEMA